MLIYERQLQSIKYNYYQAEKKNLKIIDSTSFGLSFYFDISNLYSFSSLQYNMDSDNQKSLGWTQSDEQLLFSLHRENGNKWSIISARMNNRSDNSIKNKFYSTIRKGFRNMNKYITNIKRKQCSNPSSPPKLIKVAFLAKLNAIADKKFEDKYEAREVAISSASVIQKDLIQLARNNTHEYKNGQLDYQFQEELLMKIQQFNRNCKRRKGKRKTKTNSKNVDSQNESIEQSEILSEDDQVEQKSEKIEKNNKKPFEPEINFKFNLISTFRPIYQQNEEFKQDDFNVMIQHNTKESTLQRHQLDFSKIFEIQPKEQTPTYLKSMQTSQRSTRNIMQPSPLNMQQNFENTMKQFGNTFNKFDDNESANYESQLKSAIQNLCLRQSYPTTYPLYSPVTIYSQGADLKPSTPGFQIPRNTLRIRSDTDCTWRSRQNLCQRENEGKPDILLVNSEYMQVENQMIRTQSSLFRSQTFPVKNPTQNYI